MNKKIKKIWLFLFCAFGTASVVQAQEESTVPGDEELEELSPFSVTGAGDIGYQATSTLAGTRVRADLRDIGSAISIVNEEFLRDTDSTELRDVLLFTPNTEVGGISGNFSGSQGFGAGNPIPELEISQQQGGITRIRGLAAADLTRNYFIMEIPFDTYNVDRVEVQRGANSALFGLGSPGGIVNHSLVQADFLRNRGRIKFETDEFGSDRTSFRINHILWEDRLSVFVAGLNDDQRFQQSEAFSRDRRIFGAIKFKANENVILRGNIEFGDRDRAAPDFVPPNDGISPWLDIGAPTFDSPAEAGAFFRSADDVRAGVNNNQFFGVAGGVSSGFLSFFNDPTSPDSTFGGQAFVRRDRGLSNPFPATPGEWMMLQPRAFTDIIRRTGANPDGSPIPEGSAGFFNTGFVSKQILDRSIFDYRNHHFPGGANQMRADWRAFQVALEGTWWDGRLGVELAYFDQTWDEDANNVLQGQLSRSIYIDPNRFLIATTDGTADGPLIPNPAFGQPVMGGLSQGNIRSADRETARATGFAEIRATDFMEENIVSKILGRFKLTALATRRDSDTSQTFSRDQIDPNTVLNATAGGMDGIINTVNFRTGLQHLLPVRGNVDFLNATSLSDLSGADIQPVPFGKQRNRPPRTNTFTGFDSISGQFVDFEAQTFSILDNFSFPAAFFSDKTATRIESQVLVGQHYLWDDNIVLTGTWRSDKQETATVGAPSAEFPFSRSEDMFDPRFLAGPSGLVTIADEQTTSWSIVVHTPDFINQYLPWGTQLTGFANEADNFQPSGDRVNIFNEQIAPVTGDTKERGFMVSSLNGKFNARITWYTTGVLNQSFDTGFVSSPEGILRGLVEQLDNPANAGFTAADVQAALPPQGVLDLNGFVPDFDSGEVRTNRNSNDNATQDFVSKGNEVEITYNPTENWTMLLTAARQETVTSNTAPRFEDFVNDFVLPVWVNSDFAQNFVITDDGSETLAEAATDRIVNRFLRAKLQDGNPQIEQREWRINFNTSYNFGKDSPFIPDFIGDLTVGGGVRWQDSVGVGFAVGQNEFGDVALDRDQPFFGSAQTFIDLFARTRYEIGENYALTLQANIKDLTNHDLVPIFANPDGSMLFRSLEGRVATFSATFEF